MLTEVPHFGIGDALNRFIKRAWIATSDSVFRQIKDNDFYAGNRGKREEVKKIKGHT